MAGDWKPIETAPKDETWILLWLTDDAPAPEPIVRSAFWSSNGLDWFDSEAASHPVTIYGKPTHWAPLERPE